MLTQDLVTQKICCFFLKHIATLTGRERGNEERANIANEAHPCADPVLRWWRILDAGEVTWQPIVHVVYWNYCVLFLLLGLKILWFSEGAILGGFPSLRLENLMTCGVPLAPPQHAHTMNIDSHTCSSLGKRISVCMCKYQLLLPV